MNAIRSEECSGGAPGTHAVLFSSHAQFCTPYMDDIIVFSESWSDHLSHLAQVLDKLRQAGLTANPKKCEWGGKSMEFLGHQVGGGRMSMPAHRAQALGQYNMPTTKKHLRAFLGSIGFYYRYVELLASQTAILTPLTTKQAPHRVELMEEGKVAFKCICDTISHSCSLCIQWQVMCFH